MFRRPRQRVTAGGALFMLALLLTGAGAFVSANNLLFLVFSAMLALVLVSGFLSRLVLAGLELELLLPEHVCARSATPAVVRLRNLKWFTPSFSIELSGRADRKRNTPAILATPVYFPIVPGRSTLEARVEVTFPWRGRHRESLFALSTLFPFGFMRKLAVVPLHWETLVYPCLDPQPGFEESLEETAGESAALARGEGRDFYSIRPYEPTDSARLVDWKSTAHTGSLQVREFSRDERRTVEIYLDRRVPPGGGESFERAVEFCAYLVWNLADMGVPVLARIGSDSFRIPEEHTAHDALRRLATVEFTAAGGGEPAEALEEDAIHLVLSAFPEEFEQAGWRAAQIA